jgi:effector-binding domain-containing protein
MFEIRERDVPEQLVLTEQRNLLVKELPAWLPATIDRLVKAAQQHGGVAAPVFVVYHGQVNDESDGPVEVCVPVSPAQQSSMDLPTRQEPAHREAYTRITKAQVQFPEILSAYDAVGQWLGSHGVSMAGSPREVYFTDFMAAAPTDEVCDVAFPVR